MKKKQIPQTLFKYIQSEEYEMEQENKTQLNLIKITTNIQPIFELIIENCQTFILDAQVSLQLEKLQTLIYLGINGCQIKSLIHLPLIDSLKRLTLDNNQIKEDQLKCLIYYKDKLISLSLIQNHLKITEKSGALQILKKMNLLKQLSIIGNWFNDNIDDYEQYSIENIDYINIRNELFQSLPNLIYLDCIEKDKLIQDDKFFNNQNEEIEYLSKYLSRSVTQQESSRSSSINSIKKQNNIKHEYQESEDSDKDYKNQKKQIKNMQLRKQQRKNYNF